MKAERAGCRYWIGVVSASHVSRGVEGGFAQLCHGKAAPLRRMNTGDWLVYYSPRTDMKQGEPLQAFTAIGQVADDRVYPFPMSEAFVPFRRDIRYIRCLSALGEDARQWIGHLQRLAGTRKPMD
nr:EVE domain-containing protein [Cohnella sp. YIM B05605]